jgi:hypothetical protein
MLEIRTVAGPSSAPNVSYARKSIVSLTNLSSMPSEQPQIHFNEKPWGRRQPAGHDLVDHEAAVPMPEQAPTGPRLS